MSASSPLAASRADIRALEARLHIGWVRCQNEPDGIHHERLEDFWIGLLRDYEVAEMAHNHLHTW